MGTVEATQAYIQKISIGTNPIISGAAFGKTGTTYALDDAGRVYSTVNPGRDIRDAVLAVTPGVGTVYADTTHISRGMDVRGYMTWGVNGGQSATYATDGSVIFAGNSGWYPIQTIESFNGQRFPPQGNFIKWFSSNAFGGTNYSNTPIAAVTHVEEPMYYGINTPNFFKLWEQGVTFIEAAWQSRSTPYFQAVGDPLVTR